VLIYIYTLSRATITHEVSAITLKRRIGVKNIKTNLGKRNLNYNIVNAIGGKYLRALKRPNKGKKYNSNTPKNRSNRTKRLALLGRCPSK
jgi:hypothetical protein